MVCLFASIASVQGALRRRRTRSKVRHNAQSAKRPPCSSGARSTRSRVIHICWEGDRPPALFHAMRVYRCGDLLMTHSRMESRTETQFNGGTVDMGTAEGAQPKGDSRGASQSDCRGAAERERFNNVAPAQTKTPR